MNLEDAKRLIREYGEHKKTFGESNEPYVKDEHYHGAMLKSREIEKELERLYAIEDRISATIEDFKIKAKKSNLNFIASDIQLLEYLRDGEKEA